LDSGAELVFEMDADLSHNPKYMKDLLEKASGGYDIVIGSRLEEGGGIVGWSLLRKLVSKGGNMVGRHIAGIRVRDMTSGYRLYKKEVLEKIGLDSIKANSYDFQLEMLARALRAGFKVGTVPIVFEDRRTGGSKLSKMDMVKFLLTAIRIRMYLV
jgi:dolichol-phosphate mannosyltransferase